MGHEGEISDEDKATDRWQNQGFRTDVTLDGTNNEVSSAKSALGTTKHWGKKNTPDVRKWRFDTGSVDAQFQH